MLDSYFKLKEHGTDYKTKKIGGLTTFFAMAYILGLNPALLSQTGMPAAGIFFATAISAGIACIVMGLLSGYPVGLAPGMGINALFTYTIVLGMKYSWEAALAAIFLSNMIFLILTVSKIRKSIINVIPLDLKLGIGAGIGFYLAFIGLSDSGIIRPDPTTLVSLGNIFSPPVLLAIIGIFITLILYLRKVQAAVFLGMIITSIIGLIMVSMGFGAGNELMPALPKHAITTTFDLTLFGGFTRGFGELFSNIPNLIIILFTLVFISFFDATGTLISLGRECGLIDEEGKPIRIKKALFSNALGGVIGSIFGTSTVTTFIESATGIESGAKTGLTAIVIGILFILSIFISPLILSLFKISVTTSALIIVGILIITQLKDIDWNDLTVTSSVFMTIIMMVLTYSISLGVAWGFIIYTVGKIATGKFEEINVGVCILAIIFGIYIFFGL